MMRNKKMIIVICLLCLLLIFVIVWVHLWWRDQYSYCVDMDVVDISNSAICAGDIILNASLKEKWHFSWWRHVAIAFENLDGAIDVAHFTYNGISIINVHKYLRLGSSRTVYALRKRKIELTDGEKDRLRKSVSALANSSFTTNYISTWLRRCVLPEVNNKDLTCASFVAKCLIDAGLLCEAHDLNMTKVTDFETRAGMLVHYEHEKLIDRTMFPPYPKCPE